MKRTLIFAIVLIVIMFNFGGCSNDNSIEETYELDGINLNELVEVSLPERFEEGGETMSSGPNSEVIGMQYNDEANNASFDISILAYKGKGVLGSDSLSAEEYVEGVENINVINVDGYDVYIYMTDGDYKGENVSDISIEACVTYKDHVLNFSLMNENETITREQKEEFYKIIKTIKFKPNQ